MINILIARQERLENSSNAKNKQAAGKYLRMATIRSQSPLFPIRVHWILFQPSHIVSFGCFLLHRTTCNYNLQNILISGIIFCQKDSSVGSFKDYAPKFL